MDDNLGCALIVWLPLSVVFAITNIFKGNMGISGIWLLVAIASYLSLHFDFKSTAKKDTKNKSWMKEAYKQNDIDDFKMEFILKSALAQYPDKQLLYTKDKRLFCLEMHKGVKQIELNSILKVDVECTTMEKNRQRIVALTTTFDNIKSVVGLKVKVITDRDVYNIELDPSPATIDKAKQCQLILERDLKALNQ
ncbi:hypothetical protein PN294_11155 [Romboutsia sp. 1001216sp1]|uniref:hypothetical protein n=1 Tax=unclassified Romboutsia TaxID=2626894 RepID=UPI00189DA687|nr:MULTISPECIES: hypothetical protein [unclassified Romboutsia]MDB8802750.1 hypothetical protein [Romboutsia sp. 1001216sp1]MDB8814147.1 hypothetical protein [Romboutsia sp. 1001216sp1]